MDTLVKNKNIILIAAFLILAFFLYNFFFNTATLTLENPGDSATAQAADALLQMTRDLENINFNNQTLFASPAYRSLSDFSIAVPIEPVGRSNPFDLIGRD